MLESLNLPNAEICKLFYFQNIIMSYKKKMTEFNYDTSH